MDEQLVTPDPNAAPLVEAPEPEPVLSISDHAAHYDPARDKTKDPTPDEPLAPLAADATAEQKAAHHSEQQRRDKANGQFKDGKRRHRAAKDQGTAADAPRIVELNRKLKEATDQIQRLSATPQARPIQPVAPPQAAPVQQTPSGQRWIGDPRNDPEPQEKDFGGDPMKYLSARFQWEARGVNRYERQEQQREQREEQANISFAERVHPLVQKYPDFLDVIGAFDRSMKVPKGSEIDKFILEHDKGPEVLYHLASNPQEVDALLRLPVFRQMEYLTLLSQRYGTASPQAAVTGGTGSVPRSNIRHLVPRPPNPVRTEAQRAEKTAAPLDGTLGIRAHAKQFHPR